MTKLKFIFVSILIAFLNLNVHAQGVRIYKSNKGIITIPYSELDSIVAYSKPTEIKWIDLGLPSGVKWASHNVGATSSVGYGDYFAWGETSPKTKYSHENSLTWGKTMGDISGNPQYDAATANWGGGARMPTKAECEELIKNCSSVWTKYSGVYGRRVTGPNGNSIFLPAAGWWTWCSNYVGSRGGYWSSTPYKGAFADDIYLHATDFYYGLNYERSNGLSVRPVHD